MNKREDNLPQATDGRGKTLVGDAPMDHFEHGQCGDAMSCRDGGDVFAFEVWARGEGYRRTVNAFDAWNDVTGVFARGTGYYYEMQGVIELAVHCGAQAASGVHEPLLGEPEAAPARRMTLSEQVRDAKKRVDSWTQEKRDSVRPEGIDPRRWAKS